MYNIMDIISCMYSEVLQAIAGHCPAWRRCESLPLHGDDEEAPVFIWPHLYQRYRAGCCQGPWGMGIK